MAARQRFPAPAARLERQVSLFATGLLAMIILPLLFQEGHRLPDFLAKVGLAVVLLNGLGSLVGYQASRLLGLPVPQRICLAIEVGSQNCALAIAITAGLLRNPQMAVPAAGWLWPTLPRVERLHQMSR